MLRGWVVCVGLPSLDNWVPGSDPGRRVVRLPHPARASAALAPAQAPLRRVPAGLGGRLPGGLDRRARPAGRLCHRVGHHRPRRCRGLAPGAVAASTPCAAPGGAVACVRGGGRKLARTVCCGAAPGTTTRGTAVPRTATRTSPTTATTTSASAVPELTTKSDDFDLNRPPSRASVRRRRNPRAPGVLVAGADAPRTLAGGPPLDETRSR